MCSRPKSLSGSSSESKSTATGLDDLPSSPSQRYSRSWRKMRGGKLVSNCFVFFPSQTAATGFVRLSPAPAATTEAARSACCAAGGWDATCQVRSKACGLTASKTGRFPKGRYLGDEREGDHVAAARLVSSYANQWRRVFAQSRAAAATPAGATGVVFHFAGCDDSARLSRFSMLHQQV